MFSLYNKRAQSTAEYAIVLGLVIAAAIAMQTYVKRGLQGRVAGATDNFTTKLATGLGDPDAVLKKQWEPDKLDSLTTRQVIGATVDDDGNVTDAGTHTTEEMEKGGKVTRSITQKTKQADTDYREYDY